MMLVVRGERPSRLSRPLRWLLLDTRPSQLVTSTYFFLDAFKLVATSLSLDVIVLSRISTDHYGVRHQCHYYIFLLK